MIYVAFPQLVQNKTAYSCVYTNIRERGERTGSYKSNGANIKRWIDPRGKISRILDDLCHCLNSYHIFSGSLIDVPDRTEMR